MIGQDNARFPVPDPPAVGIVRGLPNAYEVTAFGGTTSTQPTGQWSRGEIVRQFQPEVHLGPAVPMFDASDPTSQAGWTRATS